MRMILLSTALLSLLAAPASAQWGSASLFTQDGVEVRIDKRVFSLYALLNAHGYDVDTKFGPLPIKAPAFSKARSKVRSRFRRPGPAVRKFAKVIEKNPVPVRDYLRAALSLSDAPAFKGKGKLASALSAPLRGWFTKEGGGAAFRAAAASAREIQKSLQKPTDALCKKVSAIAQSADDEDALIEDSGPSGRVVVVVNELDAHGYLERVEVDDLLYIVTGPLDGDAHKTRVARAAALAFARTLVSASAAKLSADNVAAQRFASLDKSAKSMFKDQADFAAEMTACAIVKHIAAGDCDGSRLAKIELVDVWPVLSQRLASNKGPLAAALPTVLAPIAPTP